MSRRTAEEQAQKLHRVQVGEHDVISRAAYHARVPLCSRIHPKKRHLACTRAAGHQEGTHRTTGSAHVAAGIDFIATEVWT